MHELLSQGSVALRKAALNEEAKAYLLANPVLFKIVKKAADRYIGGETLDETVLKIKQQNQNEFKCSIEFMGESTRTEQEANDARIEFIRICQTIKQQKLHSTISLDLSHIGLIISSELCLHNLDLICREAAMNNIEVIISAENVDKTDAILSTYKAISRVYQNVGVTLQAYLYRTKDDFDEMRKLKGRIRIVKGAFEVSPDISLPRGEQLNNLYLGYVDQLLAENHLCSIATHDLYIQQEVKKLIHKHSPNKNNYEFESLYGIQNEQLQLLKDEGHPSKIYFVYGKEWYLYLCNRLAEYPLNVFRAISDMVE